MNKQLVLLDWLAEEDQSPPPSPREALGEITWSYTRRSTLEQCVRRYYDEYYGASKRTAKQDADKETLALLKCLKNRFERTGDLLHLAISTYFRKGKEGDIWKPERLASWVGDIFRRDIAYSQADPDGTQPPPGDFTPILLTEFHYRLSDAIELCKRAEERLVQAVLSFANEPQYEEFRRGGMRANAFIEKRTLKVIAGLPCRIDGRVDLAYEDGDRIIIVDWKIGTDDGRGDDSLQLATYALWAIEHYQCLPQALHICKVFLGSNSIVYFDCDDGLLATTRARIMQDAERMALLDRYGRDAVVQAFTPCRQPFVCRMCPFLKVCPEGKEAVYARN